MLASGYPTDLLQLAQRGSLTKAMVVLWRVPRLQYVHERVSRQ